MKKPNFYGAFVNARRRAVGLSQRDLAHRTGLSRGTIAHIETGRVDPKIGAFAGICKALDVSVTGALTTIEHAQEKWILAKRIAAKGAKAA